MSLTIICILLLLFMDIVLFVMLLINGRSTVNKGKTRKIPMCLVFVTFTGLLLFSGYNEYMLNKDVEKLQRINDSLSSNNEFGTDSLLSLPGGKNHVIDSLRQRTKELESSLIQLRKRESLSKSTNLEPVMERTKSNLLKVEKEITKVTAYNEIIDTLSLTKNLSKGFMYSGDTHYFVFYPPKDTHGNYLDFSLKFVNDNIVNKIAVLYVEVVKVKEDGSHHLISSAFYKPQPGLNNFILQNYLKEKGTKMMVGFFWKREFGIVDTPVYEKISFSINP